MIPKTIHYIWLGGQNKPLLVQKCISSWYRNLPDFKIKLWDEESLKLPLMHPYCQNAMSKKKYAFASDYCRFWILKNHGGVYLDTDMEIIKDFSSLMLGYTCFFGYEVDSLRRPNAGVIGAEIGSTTIESLINAYDLLPLSKFIVICDVMKHVISNQPELRQKIYPEKFFYPYNPYHNDYNKSNRQLMFSDITDDTYAIHHWAHSWQ